MWHDVKVRLRPRDPGTRDPGPPSKFKSGTTGPVQSLKVGPPHLSLMKSFFPEYFIVFYCCVFFNKIYAKKNINCELQKSIANTKDKKVYLKKKKLFEETEQNPSELKPHWSNNILGSSSISNPFRSISVRHHSHIQVPTRNVQWTFMGGYLNYSTFLCVVILWQKYIVFYLQ